MEKTNIKENTLNKNFKDNLLPLSYFCDVYDGTHQTPKYTHKGIPFVSVENIQDLENTSKYISKKDFDKFYPIKPNKNDILLTRIGDIGTPALIDKEYDLAFYVSLALIKIRTKEILPLYLFYFIQTPFFRKELWKRTIHNAFPIKINKNEISKCKIKVLSLTHQELIAKTLYTLDKKIKGNCELLNILKKYKKGIQKLAFKRKNNEQCTKLSSLVLFMPKSKLSASDSIENGKYPFYLSGEKAGTVNSFMYEGCYIIANDGGEAGFRLSDGPFAYSNHCICFCGENEWITRNLYEYLDSQKNKITFIGFLGSGLKNIDRGYLQNFKVPTSIENKKIAILFLLLNKKIRHIQNKLMLLKVAKRYLLANMFI